MQKRLIFIFIPLVLVIFFSVYYFFFAQSKSFSGGSALRGISSQAALILRTGNAASLVSKTNNNPLWAAASGMPQLLKISKQLSWADSLMVQYPEAKDFLSGKECYIAIYPDANRGIVPVFLIELQSKTEADFFHRIASTETEKLGFQIFEKKYQRTTIYESNNPKNGQRVAAWGVWDGVALISPKTIFIEDAIREFENNDKEIDLQFDALLKTVVTQCDFNLFVHNNHIEKILQNISSEQIKALLPMIKRFSEWTELDVTLHSDRLTLSGFSVATPDEQYMSAVWLKQTPSGSGIEKILPYSSAWYMGYTISDVQRFFNDYRSYLSHQNASFERENQLKKIKNYTGGDPEQFFADHFDKEMALAAFENTEGTRSWGKTWVFKVKSGRTAMNQLTQWQSAYIASLRLVPSEWTYDYMVDKTTVHQLFKNPFPELPSIVFGPVFNHIAANYFTVLGNYMLFADSPETMATLIRSNLLGETLNGNIEYNKFQSTLTSKSNINFYCNTNLSLAQAGTVFSPSVSESMFRNDQMWKFRMFGGQVVSSGNMLYNNACLTFSSEMKSKPQTVWKSHMDAPTGNKPQFVVNHNDPQNKEIMVQDQNNNLYLMNNVGRILWKLKLDSKILGEIHQVDFFKNGKLQYLFNTESRLHLIDRNGNYVSGYPVSLREKATNGASVFDYDQNRNYRFFLACADNNVYGYESSGKLVDGWEIFQTDHPVKQRIEYFRSEGKDYIVVSDEMKDYILNRRGEIRVPTNLVYPHSKNNPIYFEERTATTLPRVVSTDLQGTIHYTYLDGTTETAVIKEFGSDHFFLAANLVGDDAYEYIFAQGNNIEIYDNNLKPLLVKHFDHPISHMPNLYQFSNNAKKIGLVAQSASLIYLLNVDGSLHEGFPLIGASPFSIGFISENSTNFNLLVGGPDGYLYNYYIE
jgi:hypothetical protein